MKKVLSVLFFTFFLFCCREAKAAHFLQIEEVVSPGGIRAWLVRDDRLPLISIRFAFRGGTEQDPPDKQGLAEMTASLLTQGAGPYDVEAFQKKLANNSIRMDFSAGRDAIRGGLKTLKSTRKEAFSLLRLALTSPRFDPDSIERIKAQQITALQFELGSASWQARRALFSHIFAGHPYSLRKLGTEETVNNITSSDIRSFTERILARGNLLVAVTGDIAPAELAIQLDNIFGGLPALPQPAQISEAEWPEERAVILVKRDGTQTNFAFALPMPRRDDPDWFAAEIVNYILGGGGFSSRLMLEARDKAGLTYGIQTALAPMDHASILIGQAAVNNPDAGETLDKIKKVLLDIHENSVTQEEIEAAKDYLTGSLPLALTNTDAIANTLLDIQLDKLGRDYLERRNLLIRQVDTEAVLRVTFRWFDPGKMSFALVGAPEGINPTIIQEQVKR